MDQDPGFLAALDEAKTGAREGGIPIGAAVVDKDGKILGQGHNMRVQKNSAILHVSHQSFCQGVFFNSNLQGETSALENAGRLPASAYKGATMSATPASVAPRRRLM